MRLYLDDISQILSAPVETIDIIKENALNIQHLINSELFAAVYCDPQLLYDIVNKLKQKNEAIERTSILELAECLRDIDKSSETACSISEKSIRLSSLIMDPNFIRKVNFTLQKNIKNAHDLNCFMSNVLQMNPPMRIEIHDPYCLSYQSFIPRLISITLLISKMVSNLTRKDTRIELFSFYKIISMDDDKPIQRKDDEDNHISQFEKTYDIATTLLDRIGSALGVDIKLKYAMPVQRNADIREIHDRYIILDDNIVIESTRGVSWNFNQFALPNQLPNYKLKKKDPIFDLVDSIFDLVMSNYERLKDIGDANILQTSLFLRPAKQTKNELKQVLANKKFFDQTTSTFGHGLYILEPPPQKTGAS